MNPTQIAALVLIVAGAPALAYGGFTYTKDTYGADIDPTHKSIAEKERVDVPIWAGLGALLVGGALLIFGSKR